MKCKFCNAELLDNTSVCPDCGQDNAAVEGEKKTGTGKIAMIVVASVVLLAVLVALIVMGTGGFGGSGVADTTAGADTTAAATEGEVVYTVPADGNPDDETCKGTYTVTDDAAAAAMNEVVATMGDATLTNGELQVYYWMSVYNFLSYYSDYVSYLGLDMIQGLDVQTCSYTGTGTWQQYFLAEALNSWVRFQALTLDAEAAQFEMGEEYAADLENLRTEMEAAALEDGYESLEAMLIDQLGAGCSFADYQRYMYEYYMGFLHYSAECEKITLTDDEIAAFYEEHKAEYEENGLTEDMVSVDVRHILLQPEGCTFDDYGYVEATDEQWESCRVQAQGILDDWLANDGTEEGFGALAKEHTVDGNGDVGGLYEGVEEGQMVTNFNDWCFDAARVPGDSGLVQTEFGYHIMYFVGSQPLWLGYAEADLLTEKQNGILDLAVENHPYEVDYSKIVLGYVPLVAES